MYFYEIATVCLTLITMTFIYCYSRLLCNREIIKNTSDMQELTRAHNELANQFANFKNKHNILSN